MSHILREEILKGQDCPPDLEANLANLLIALNKFRAVYAVPMFCTSGLRDPVHNAAVGGKPGSAHLTCEAADFADDKRLLRDFCLGNLPLLEECGLWMEDPKWTPGWVHLQSRAAINRVFIP